MYNLKIFENSLRDSHHLRFSVGFYYLVRRPSRKMTIEIKKKDQTSLRAGNSLLKIIGIVSLFDYSLFHSHSQVPTERGESRNINITRRLCREIIDSARNRRPGRIN